MALTEARISLASRDALVRELREAVGAAHVLSDPGDLLAYEYDASNLTAVPDLAVLPGSAEEVARVLAIAARHGIPVVPRGAGTGVAGGALAIVGGLVVVMTRLNRILEVDLASRVIVVEPGVTNVEISRAVSREGYFYAPDPSSQYASSIGGNVAHNSGGPHTIAYGVTTHHVLGVEIALPSGDLVRVGGVAPDSPSTYWS